MINRRVVLIAFAAAVAALVTASSTQAWALRTNYLTFSGPVALPGVTLAAGTYTFEAGPLDSNPAIVRVSTRDGRRVLFQGFTTPVSRPAGRMPVVTFGEAPAGRPMPIRVLYPTNASIRHQFRY